jgi:hypothetical protein
VTTVEDVLAVLSEGERISYSTLLERLRDWGHQPRGVLFALDDPRIDRRWRTGEPYSFVHAYDEKDRGPMFVARSDRVAA